MSWKLTIQLVGMRKLLLFVEIKSQGGLRIGIFLPLTPKCWEYRHVPPQFTLGNWNRKKARCGHTHLKSRHSKGRGRWISLSSGSASQGYLGRPCFKTNKTFWFPFIFSFPVLGLDLELAASVLSHTYNSSTREWGYRRISSSRPASTT